MKDDTYLGDLHFCLCENQEHKKLVQKKKSVSNEIYR